MAILEEQELKNITDAGIRQKVEAGSIEPYEVADAIDAAYEAIAFAGQPLDHALAAFSAGEAAAALALQMGEAALIIGQEAPRVADGAAAVETMAAGKVDKAPGARLIGTGELSSLQARLAAIEAAANPALQLLYHEDFEGDPADVWEGLSKQYVNNLPHSFQQLANPYGVGGVGRFELRQTDAMQSNGMRSEVLWPQPASADNDRWYAFRYYLPSQEDGVDTWADDNKQDILTQWHQGSGNPPVSLRAINSALRLNVRSDGVNINYAIKGQRTYSTDWDAVSQAKSQLQAGASAYMDALGGLRSRAPMTRAPYTVGDAANKPTSVKRYFWNGTDWQVVKNDDNTDFTTTWDYSPLTPEEAARTHYTLRTYWGPDYGANAGNHAYMRANSGEPYLNRDGKTYPLVGSFRNSANASDICYDLYYAGLMFHLASGADKVTAGNQLAVLSRAYFSDPETGMLPHLLFAQVARGLYDNYGDSPGFVDFEAFSKAIDGLILGEAGMPPAEVADMKAWVREFWTWYTVTPPTSDTSERAVAHRRIVGAVTGASSNIRIFYECCVCQMAIYLGETAWVTDRMETLYPGLLGDAFDMAATHERTGGRQGAALAEVGRTKPWTYVNKNLNGWMELARIARGLGIDLYNMVGSNGATLQIAVRWLAYYAQDPAAWTALPKGGTEASDTTSTVYFFKYTARTARKEYSGDAELQGWLNAYLTLKDSKFSATNVHTEASFLAGRDWERLIQVYPDVAATDTGYTKDAWVHLIFHIRWALDSTGLIEVWYDGVKLHTITGPNMFSGYPLPRWKLGIYKSDWNNGATTNVTLRVAYFDDVRMAGPEATFQDLMQGLALTPLAIPDKDAIDYPDPPMLLTNSDIVNGQIVITDKRISSEDAKVSCINLMNVTQNFTLVMRNVITRQNGIHIRGHYSRFSFDIENCFGFDWENGPGSGRVDDLSATSIWGNWYLRVNDPYYGRLRHCYVEGSGLYKIEYSKANEASCKGVLIECNYSRNVRQPNALMNWGNLKGAEGATIPGILIRWNYVWNTLGEHWVEDTWNTYTLKGAAHSPIILEHNFFDGAAKDPAATEYTGGGAIVDGKGAITRATIAENIRIRYNQFVRCRNYLAACACGYGVYIYGNRGVVSGLNPDGTPVPSWTSGFWSGDYSSSKTQSGNIRIYQNTVGARNGSSGRLDFAAWNEDQVNHTEIYDNTSLPEPLTVATEDAEYAIWEAKLAANKITLGPVTPMTPVPQP